jgi:flavoprotein
MSFLKSVDYHSQVNNMRQALEYKFDEHCLSCNGNLITTTNIITGYNLRLMKSCCRCEWCFEACFDENLNLIDVLFSHDGLPVTLTCKVARKQERLT